MEMQFRDQTGGFEFKDFDRDESSTTKFVGIVKERGSDNFARFVIEVDPADERHITSLSLNIVPRPAKFAIPRMTERNALAAFRELLEKEAVADRFSGVALVAKNGTPIFTSAYGMADREKKIQNTPNTKFRIGSMNKMFTATAVLQLAQAGKLKLSDPVGKYLTNYPNKTIATKVTVEQLLSHTGGTGDFFGPEFDKHRLELKTLDDYVKLYGTREPKFEPGSRWEYSNYGFLLLGLIVEKASGEDYYAYVREHIYKPAGMNSTDSLPEDQTVPDRSVGYTKFDGAATWKPNTDTLPGPRHIRWRRLLHRRRLARLRHGRAKSQTARRATHRLAHHRSHPDCRRGKIRVRLHGQNRRRSPFLRPRRRRPRHERRTPNLPSLRLRNRSPGQPRPARRIARRRLHRQPPPAITPPQ